MPFQKGHVANRTGRPSVSEAIAALVRRKAGASGKKLVALLYDLALTDPDSNVRLKAATFLIERGYGKPPVFDERPTQVVVLVGQGSQAIGPNPWDVLREQAIDAGEPVETWTNRPLRTTRAERLAEQTNDLPENVKE